MRLIREKDLSHLLRTLSHTNTHRLLNSLSSILITLSNQNLQSERDDSTTSKAPELLQPPRMATTTPEGHTTLFMPSSTPQTSCIKTICVPSSASAKPLKGTIALHCASTGILQGLLSAAEITAFRTALATMTLLVRCTTLTRRRIVVFGAGKQAEWHVRLALKLLPAGTVESVVFVNRGLKKAQAMEEGVVVDLKVDNPNVLFEVFAKEGLEDREYQQKLKTVLAAADVMFCCTPSTEPLFPYRYLSSPATTTHRAPQRQRFISLIGSYKPHMQEIDTETLLSGGRVWVDSKEMCLAESGELIRAKLTEDYLIELGEFFSESSTAVAASNNASSIAVNAAVERHRQSVSTSLQAVPVAEGKNVIFKCVGMGVMDLVTAQTLLEMAREEDIGVEIEDM